MADVAASATFVSITTGRPRIERSPSEPSRSIRYCPSISTTLDRYRRFSMASKNSKNPPRRGTAGGRWVTAAGVEVAQEPGAGGPRPASMVADGGPVVAGRWPFGGRFCPGTPSDLGISTFLAGGGRSVADGGRGARLGGPPTAPMTPRSPGRGTAARYAGVEVDQEPGPGGPPTAPMTPRSPGRGDRRPPR